MRQRDVRRNAYQPVPHVARTVAPQVHVDCLNEWRKQSVNPRSLYTCDACGYSYRIPTQS